MHVLWTLPSYINPALYLIYTLLHAATVVSCHIGSQVHKSPGFDPGDLCTCDPILSFSCFSKHATIIVKLKNQGVNWERYFQLQVVGGCKLNIEVRETVENVTVIWQESRSMLRILFSSHCHAARPPACSNAFYPKHATLLLAVHSPVPLQAF